ncbi:MAG TPA: hypothetical protein VGE52_07535 [Pirellulales bacterium]
MFGWRQSVRIAVVTCVLTLGTTGVALAQEYAVTYKLSKWTSKHFKTEAAAQKDAEFLEKNLGCEVQLHAHDGHFDVTYRCEKWQQLTLKSDDEAHEWQAWLKKRGFETQHTH